VYRTGIVFLIGIFLTACGGGGSNSIGSSGSSGSGGGSGSPPRQFTAVNVASGKTSTGIDVTVAPPAASPAPNAQVLGAGGNTAFGTGAQIHRGQTASVLLFGSGLSGSMTVRISGPADITVTSINAVKATDGTPGIQFSAAVSSGAALGGRTVFLTDSQNDITAFSGGLEVIQ
jgi:hypothetical protein